jgi:hypothetical protein
MDTVESDMNHRRATATAEPDPGARTGGTDDSSGPAGSGKD